MGDGDMPMKLKLIWKYICTYTYEYRYHISKRDVNTCRSRRGLPRIALPPKQHPPYLPIDICIFVYKCTYPDEQHISADYTCGDPVGPIPNRSTYLLATWLENSASMRKHPLFATGTAILANVGSG